MTRKKKECKNSRNITPKSVVHYCTIETVTKILEGAIKSSENYITLWLSHLTMMNDANEGAYILDKYYTDSALKRGLKQGWYNEFYPRNIPFIFSTIKTNPQTRDKGFLPMWKMYGENFKGALIRFDAKKLKRYCEDNNLIFEACMYETTESRNRQIKRLNQQSPDFEELLRLSCLTKQICWKYEAEWRIIAKRTKEDIKVRDTERGSVQYIELKLPLDIIEEICLGPMCDKENAKQTLISLRDKLAQEFGEKVHFNITSSSINIR